MPQTPKYLVDAGVNLRRADRSGATSLARARVYREMVVILEKAGTR